MDKYEYKLKTEQMLELMEDGAFNKAAEIADSIDWKRVRNTKMLTDVSDIYEKNGDYQKSYEVLNIAYHRAEGSRKIIYRLCTLALKTKNVDEAIDYYDDFQQIAPKDPNKFILRYQILRAQRAPIEQQIEALEAFKKAEYIEEWAYELAKRYQEAGMTAECLEECDDLILWFNEGKYVYQAMELKMQYKPLTPSQQEKYDQRFAAMSNETMEMPDVVEYQKEKDAAAKDESIDTMLAAAEDTTEETDGEPAQEPKKRETTGRKIGSTMKLDEALKSLLNLGMGEEDKVKDSSSEPVSTDVIFEEDKFKDAIEEIEAVADLDLIDELASQKGLRELKVDPDLEELLPDDFSDEPLEMDLGGEQAGTPLEKQDMDTKQIGAGLGGDTRVLDKETLQAIAAFDKESNENGVADMPAAGKSEEAIAELDEDAREIIAELDEEARRTIEELDNEVGKSDAELASGRTMEEPGMEEPGTEEGASLERYGARTVKAAEEQKDQVEGQMNLLDLMADLDADSEITGDGQMISADSEIFLDTGVEEAEDIELSEEAEEYSVEQKKSKAGEPILPLDIQRMIDEIEGTLPVEDTDKMAEKEALGEQTAAVQKEEPKENMGEIAEQLRVDETSEWFEDYDDVLDEEEYSDELPEEIEEPEEEEFTEDIEISFGGEEEEIAEDYEEEVEFGDIREEETEYEELEYAEDAEYEEADYVEDAEYEEPEYAEEADYVEEAEYEEPEYAEDADYEEPEYAEEMEYEDQDEERSYPEEEPEYTEQYEEEPEYEEAVYEEDAAYTEEEYEEDGLEYENGEYEDEDAEEYDDAAVYEEEYGDAGYEEEPEYEEEYEEEEDLEYAEEYDEEAYEGDYGYEEEEYYAEEEYEEEEEYDAASVEANLEHEFRPQKASKRRYDEREVPDEEEEMDILSATTPLSRKETAKLIATGKTSPLPMDEISDALSMSDTGFVVHGRYDLRTQSGIGTRAGLTEEQKKLFSYFVPVRGMSEQLVDVLEQDKNCTNRKGTSITGNLLIIGNKGNGKTVLAVDVVKAIQKQRNIRQGRVAIVTGDSLNKKKISDIFSKLYGGALIIEKAGKMNEKTVARVNKAMERDTGELLIVLEDQRKPLDRLLTSNREFRRKFTSRLEVPILINDELVTFGQTYAQENGYQIDEMGILALYSRIDMLQREDHAVTIAEVKEVMDEAMEHSQKASAKKLVKRVLGKNRDDSDRIILTEKDFI